MLLRISVCHSSPWQEESPSVCRFMAESSDSCCPESPWSSILPSSTPSATALLP